MDTIHPDVWKAHQLGSDSAPRVPSGYPELDAQLPGGGWPARNLIELLLRHRGIGEIRFLIPALRRLTQAQRRLIIMSPPLIPVPAVFEQFGIDHQQITLVHAAQPQDRLWAIEQLLQSDSFGALLMWLPEEQHLVSPLILRRLQYQAKRSEGLSFVFRPMVAQQQPSPASLRLCLSAHSPNTLRVHLIKRRGPVLEEPLHIHLPLVASALPGLVDQHDLLTEQRQRTEEVDRAMDRRVPETLISRETRFTGEVNH